MTASYLQDIEFSRRAPPADLALIIKLADRVRANLHAMVSMALRERGYAQLSTETPERINAAALLAMAWEGLTPAEVQQVADLALRLQK